MNDGETPTVAVVGNLNMDLIFRGVESLPAWGEGVEASDHLLASAGQAGYLALALGHLGVSTGVVGNVGDDEWGQRIMTDLARAGTAIGGIEVSPGRRTAITAAISRRTDGERAFVGDLGHLDEFDEALVARNWQHIRASQLVCLAGLFDLSRLGVAGAGAVLERAKREGKATLLDTGWDGGGWSADTRAGLARLMPAVTLLIVNIYEACGITGETNVEAAADRLSAQGAETVVIKCGERGSYARRGRERVSCPAIALDPTDAVGAGDVYNAGYIQAWLQGQSLSECMALGTKAASAYLRRGEDRFPVLADLREA